MKTGYNNLIVYNFIYPVHEILKECQPVKITQWCYWFVNHKYLVKYLKCLRKFTACVEKESNGTFLMQPNNHTKLQPVCGSVTSKVKKVNKDCTVKAKFGLVVLKQNIYEAILLLLMCKTKIRIYPHSSH